MFQKIKNNLYAMAAVVTLGASLLAPIGVAGAANTIQQALCDGTTAAAGSTSGECKSGSTDGTKTALSRIATQIVTIFSYIVGIISVIFIIYGGFKYVTSGGDSNNVSSAKNTLIYALIGLVIVALAQFLVNVVFSAASSSVNP